MWDEIICGGFSYNTTVNDINEDSEEYSDKIEDYNDFGDCFQCRINGKPCDMSGSYIKSKR